MWLSMKLLYFIYFFKMASIIDLLVLAGLFIDKHRYVKIITRSFVLLWFWQVNENISCLHLHMADSLLKLNIVYSLNVFVIMFVPKEIKQPFIENNLLHTTYKQ